MRGGGGGSGGGASGGGVTLSEDCGVNGVALGPTEETKEAAAAAATAASPSALAFLDGDDLVGTATNFMDIPDSS